MSQRSERGGGSTLIGTLSQIFSIFYFDASPRLELAKFWFGSVASLKFDCLIQTGQMLDGQILHGEMLHRQMLHGQMLHRQMLHEQMLHGQMVLGLLSTVKDGSTNLKCPPQYFPWGVAKS